MANPKKPEDEKQDVKKIKKLTKKELQQIKGGWNLAGNVYGPDNYTKPSSSR